MVTTEYTFYVTFAGTPKNNREVTVRVPNSEDNGRNRAQSAVLNHLLSVVDLETYHDVDGWSVIRERSSDS